MHVREIGARARIGECAELGDALPLQARWPEVGERIIARIVVVTVAPDEGSECKYGVGAEDVRPRGCDVEGADLRALVRWPYYIAVWIEAGVINYHAVPGGGVFSV